MTCGVIGNTPDSGSGESRFEPWQVNHSELGVHSLYVLLFCKTVLTRKIHEFFKQEVSQEEPELV